MRFDHILFATDFSRCSQALAGEAERLANRFHSKLTIMNVIEIPALWYLAMQSGSAVLESIEELKVQVEKQLAEYPIRVAPAQVRRVLRTGDPATEIADYVQREGVDLVILGTHGNGPIRSLLSGSVLGKVLHDVGCCVWTAAPQVEPASLSEGITKVLCALELTDEAVPLLQFTAEVARAFSAQVRVVHAVAGAETRPNKYFDFELNRYIMESARIEICRLQRIAQTDFPITIGSGSIAEAVAEAASEFGSELVVVGRGRVQGTLGRLRTHAYDIIRRVPCPVLSYAPSSQDHTSSSCIEAHLAQCVTVAPPQTGCLRP